MQPLTPDFVFTQLRIAAIAGIAYAGGAGYFSPAGVTLATALVMSLLPIAVPWAFSIWANWRMVKVPDSLTIRPSDVAIAADNSPGTGAKIEEIVKVAKQSSVAFVLLSLFVLGGCTTAQKQAGTSAAATVIRSVPDLQSRTAYVCGFVPLATVAAAILKVDTGSIGEVATGICNALKTQVQTFGFMTREPSYKGVILKGKFVP